MRAFKLLPVLLVLLSLVKPAHAQVAEAAVGSDRHLWVGAEFSDFNPDYNPIAGRLTGIGFWGDYAVTRSFSAEAEARFLDLNKPSGQTQKNFLIGPLFDAYRYHGFTAYAKVLFGVNTVNYPYFGNTNISIGNGSYFALAPGGGVEYRLNSRFKIRGEYEYQFMPGAPGIEITAPRPSSGLTPSGYSAGISYRIY